MRQVSTPTGLRAYPPLPVNPAWAPSYLRGRPGAVNRDFAYALQDAEGAPSSSGARYHGGVDWFAPAGTVIRAPRAGKITRFEPSSDSSGPVFGGVLALEEASGIVWTMRHVQPTAGLGSSVEAGDVVATVHPWDGGATHLHLEIWRSAAGGYRFENMLDPAAVVWDSAALEPAPPAFYFEELPAAQGGTGPDVVGQAAGYAKPAVAAAAALLMRARGWAVSSLRADDGRTYLLRWAKGTYGGRFRFGPWASEAHRNELARSRAGNTGRTMRPYQGRAASLYPWPDGGGET